MFEEKPIDLIIFFLFLQVIVISQPKPHVESPPESSEVEKIDYEKAEEIVKEALETVQKMEQSVLSMSKIVSVSPKLEETPPLSPKLITPRRESSSSASSTASSSTRKRVVVRWVDSLCSFKLNIVC